MFFCTQPKFILALIISRTIVHQLKNYHLIENHFIKKASMSTLKIGTHDGRFHCDEALACFMIKKLPQFKNATIVRSRDINLLNNCDIVVDVGGVYDPEKLRFDHHQKEFDVSIKTILPDSQCKALKLSSAGLIYAHYGKEIIADYNNWDKNDQKTNLVFDIVYNCFINEIDAIDNGKFKLKSLNVICFNYLHIP